MFKRILIAEDHESANLSVQRTLEKIGIKGSDYVYYCDDALMRIQKAIKSGSPYELLITDLYFELDHREQNVSGGAELIEAAKSIQPDLKVLVFSATDKVAAVELLFKELNIDGFVRKARNDSKDLMNAIETIYKNRKYQSLNLKWAIKEKNTHEFTSFDITIISLLAGGKLQKDIPFFLQANKIIPSSLSSIEKRLNRIKEVLELSSNEHLVAYCKDMHII